MRDLTPEILEEMGFKKRVWFDDDGDEVINWSNEALTLFDDSWSKPSYSFAERTRSDGSFKSGWNIVTDEQLLLLIKALTGKI